jgi:hypothetical protein
MIASVTGLSLASTLAAAQEQYFRKGTFAIGGGVNGAVGESAPYFNSSGTFYFSGGSNVSPRFAILVEYTHNWLAIAPEVFDRAAAESTQVQEAYASLWSLTANGVLRFNPGGAIVPWITGGGGYYKRNLMLTQYALVYYPPVFDPWWGWIDGGWGPGEAIVGEREEAGIGYNVGFGLDFQIDHGASLFIEARYHQAFLDGVDLQIVPIMAGVRW